MALKTAFLLLFLTLTSFSQTYFDDFQNMAKSENLNLDEALVRLSEIEKEVFSELEELSEMANFSLLKNEQVNPEDVFKDQLTDWNKDFKKNNIKKILKKIIKNPSSVSSSSSAYAKLKKNRKIAHYLRQTFYMFDQRSTPPKDYAKFVKHFGKLNDAIASADSRLSKKLALELLELKEAIDMDNFKTSFRPKTKEQFLADFSSGQKKIKKLLKAETLSVHKYHWLRKQIKLFSHLYLISDTSLSKEKQKFFANVLDKFGDLNDVYTDIQIRFKTDLEDHDIKLGKELKDLLLKIIKHSKKDLCELDISCACALSSVL